MKKRCRHKRTWTRHRLLLKTANVANGITDKVCQSCGEQLALGLAHDTPATAIELEAARMAAECAHKPGCVYLVDALMADTSSPAHDTIRSTADILAHDATHKDSTP